FAAPAEVTAGKLVSQVTPTPTPGPIIWYYASPSPWPSPVFSGYAAVGGAFGAANFYNSGTSPYATISPGTSMLNTSKCFFICYSSPGHQSHHFLAYGNDVDAGSFTSQGAPDDCASVSLCP